MDEPKKRQLDEMSRMSLNRASAQSRIPFLRATHLEHAREGKDEAAGRADEEHGRNVERKRRKGI